MMRPSSWKRAVHVSLIVGLLLASVVGGQALPLADASSLAPWPQSLLASNSGYQESLHQAAQMEQAGRWSEALKLYSQGHKSWPQVPEFQQGVRRCQAHLDLAQRYGDSSFQASLSRISRPSALALYDEVLLKISTYYVDHVDFSRLAHSGTESLRLALTDPVFLRANRVTAGPNHVEPLRSQLLSLQRASVVSRWQARQLVERACDLSAERLGLRASAVVLEYVYGACAALDRHSGFLTADRLGDLHAQIDGNFVGLGVEVQADNQGLRIMGVISNSPAAEHGMRTGDHIVAVDGQSLLGMGTDEAADQLKGPPGTHVQVMLVPASGGQSRRLLIRRRHVVVKSISQSQLLDPRWGIAYIQLNNFQKTTSAELDAALWRLRRAGMRLLILDLRGNPGGLLSSAVEVGDRFIDHGTIVATYGRAPGQSWHYQARSERTWHVPMVVLVDELSASASEIVAAALADFHRAVLVGRRSYGKGEVQSIYPLTTISGGLRLTTARFYSPMGRPLSGRGVTPDVTVQMQRYHSSSGSLEQDPDLRAALEVAKRQLARR